MYISPWIPFLSLSPSESETLESGIINQLRWIGSHGWDVPSGFPKISSVMRQTWLPSHLGAQLKNTGFPCRGFQTLELMWMHPLGGRQIQKRERASERQS